MADTRGSGLSSNPVAHKTARRRVAQVPPILLPRRAPDHLLRSNCGQMAKIKNQTQKNPRIKKKILLLQDF
jgi:hypothetical protein